MSKNDELSKKERALLLEYARWYDSYLAPPEQLIEEFLQNRGKTIVDEKESGTSTPGNFSLMH